MTGRASASIWPRRQRRGERTARRTGPEDGQGFNLATTSASWRTAPVQVRTPRESVASIWPRRQRRGERTAGGRRRPRRPCFNLATTSASWRTPSCPRRPRRSAGFNLATTSASWRTRRPPRVTPGRQPLQFGHDVSVVENRDQGVVWGVFGGLQFGHDVSVVENGRRRRWTPRRPARFNLATTSASWRTSPRTASARPTWPLQFGHDVSVVENATRTPSRPSRRCRFNLATTSASWRTTSVQSVVNDGFPLQFGHDVSVVENATGRAGRGRARRASIWPRRQRRGEPSGACSHDRPRAASIWPRRQRRGEHPHRRPGRHARRRPRGFNLATTSASWRTLRPRVHRYAEFLLQFGHDVSVVENSPATGVRRSSSGLQFGHDVSVVENDERVVRAGDPDPASIWPRRQRRGELPRLRRGRPELVASIWPRRQRRGEPS